MYPKVKVREQREEADQYAYEKSSLKSLKAFEWLSLHDSPSADESTGSVVRIPSSYISVSPPPSFRSSKEETDKKKKTAGEETRKNVRSTSAQRPRAVLSSPDNDAIIGRKRTEAERQIFLGLKDHNSCQHRHIQCKIFPKSDVAESFAHTKLPSEDSTDFKDNGRTKGKTMPLVNSSSRGGHRRRIAPAPIQS